MGMSVCHVLSQSKSVVFDEHQRSVTHDSLRYINILTYLLTYLLSTEHKQMSHI